MAITVTELLSGLGATQSVASAQSEVRRLEVMLDNARIHSPDQVPAVRQALASAKGSLRWALLAPVRERNRRLAAAVTSGAPSLSSGISTDAWLRRAETTGAGLPRHSSYYGPIPSMVEDPALRPPRLPQTALAPFSKQLSYSDYMHLKRAYPELLRDWLRSGRYTLPPSIQFPGASSPGEAARRQRAVMARRGVKVTGGPGLPSLTSTAEAARLQAEEMASRGVRTYKPKSWTSDPITQQRQSERELQNLRLKGLTKDSAAFRAMTVAQKIAYLKRLAPTFRGNSKFKRMLARYQRRQAESTEMIDMIMAKAHPEIALAQEARKQAATARARQWIRKIQDKNVYDSNQIPGYDRIPHGSHRGVVQPRSPVAPPTPRVAFTQPAAQGRSAQTHQYYQGHGRIPGQPYAQQYSHGQIVAGKTLPPMTYSSITPAPTTVAMPATSNPVSRPVTGGGAWY
jgi:hypothetical protein